MHAAQKKYANADYYPIITVVHRLCTGPRRKCPPSGHHCTVARYAGSAQPIGRASPRGSSAPSAHHHGTTNRPRRARRSAQGTRQGPKAAQPKAEGKSSHGPRGEREAAPPGAAAPRRGRGRRGAAPLVCNRYRIPRQGGPRRGAEKGGARGGKNRPRAGTRWRPDEQPTRATAHEGAGRSARPPAGTQARRQPAAETAEPQPPRATHKRDRRRAATATAPAATDEAQGRAPTNQPLSAGAVQAARNRERDTCTSCAAAVGAKAPIWLSRLVATSLEVCRYRLLILVAPN